MVHVIGVQEVRRKFTGVVTEYGYTLAQAACGSNGSGGVIVGVSNSLKFAHPIEGCRLPLTVSADDVNIVVAKPRSIFVRASAPRFQMLTASIHGLDNSYGIDAVVEFWDQAFFDFCTVWIEGDNVAIFVD